MNIIKIVFYFTIAFIFIGCVRPIPDSTVLPEIKIDKKYNKSKRLSFNDQIFSVYSPNNKLIVVNRVGGSTFINPKTLKKIKEFDKTYILIGDLPYPIFSRYDEKLNKTSLECTDSNGVELWSKSFFGKLLNVHDDLKEIIIAVKYKMKVRYISLDKNNGELNWTNKKDSNSFKILFLDNDDKLYTIIDNNLYEILSNGKFSYIYEISIKDKIKRLIFNDNLIIFYTQIDDYSKAILEVIDITAKKIVFQKVFEIEEDSYNDIAINNNIIYVINDKKLSSFEMLSGYNILNKEVDIDDGYETLNDIVIYKDKIMLVGQSEIYAYSKKDFSLLWKHEELWTPYRLSKKERDFNAALAGGMASFYNYGHSNAYFGNFYHDLSTVGIAINEYMQNKSSSKGTYNIAFIRGYATTTMIFEYDAVVYLINLDSGKSQNIKLKDRHAYCYPNVYVDVKNKVIYESYGVQHLWYGCPTSNQLDILEY